MLDFLKENNRLILSYSGEQTSSNWIYSKLANSGSVTLRNTFTVSPKELISAEDPSNEDAPVKFVIASRDGEYYKFTNDVLKIENDLLIDVNIEFTSKIFIAERNISVFSTLDRLSAGTIRIGGPDPNSIPETAFMELLQRFPNSYELTRYASARVGAVISSYMDTKEDCEEKYHKYMNKKETVKGKNLYKMFATSEIEKYKSLSTKLTHMLEDEVSYSENQWQKEILQIILLIYPKYIHVFEEVPVRDTYNDKNRSIDLLLVDSTGNTDIIEIKKPFDKCIITDRTYRDNHIPLRELSGTVMQVEKYIFYLNKWGKQGEKKLTDLYHDQLSDGFDIRITNPGAIIIMGRSNNLSEEQRKDFEVIKRKYKNIIDVITYDELLDRLDMTLKRWLKYKG